MKEGKLPKGWTFTKCQNLYSQIRGVNYSKGDAFTVESVDSVLILRGGNVQDGKIVRNNDEVFVSESLVKEIQLLKKEML
jgi:type I restriction enzyme S subunit